MVKVLLILHIFVIDVTQTFVGTNFTISGWGTTSFGGAQSPDLKAGLVQGLSNLECSTSYSGLTSNMICAASQSVDTDTCQGDSGGIKHLKCEISSHVAFVALFLFYEVL